MPLINRFADLHAEITGWRRDMHAHPELCFEETRTAALVANLLQDFGVDQVKTGIGKTGVVGVIKGKQNTSGKVMGLRADMDALPIFEATGVDYSSTVKGKMHACGHDGHTAMLLGAAKYLAETRNFDGTVVLIFQPAEEGGAGGREMCRDGLMEEFGIQEVYGLHNMPNLPLGDFGIRPGGFFAAADEFSIAVKGKGGHGALPHEAIDTTLVASQIVIALQSIAARNVDPLKPLVVSVTSVQTESDAFNVIPEHCELRGTVRSLDPEVRDLAQAMIERIVPATALAFGASAKLDYKRGYPVTVNAPEQTDFAASVAEKVAGIGRVNRSAPQRMGAEDFSYMLEERPGAYIILGTGPGHGVHHPEYNFNDEAIPAGCSYWAQLVETGMPAT